MKTTLPTLKVAAVSNTRISSKLPVEISTRRNVLSAGVLGTLFFQFNGEQACASNKEEVAARRERLAKKEALKESAVSDKESLVSDDKTASKTTILLSAREKRLAALREKAARIRSGEAPTF